MARLGLAIALCGVFMIPVMVWSASDRDHVSLAPPLGALAVLASVVIAFTWEEPAVKRRRDYLRAVLVDRGVVADRFRDHDFVGASPTNHGKTLGIASDDIGFASFETAFTLHLASADVRIPRDALLDVSRERFRGDTMAIYGVRPIRLRWRPSPGGALESLYLVAKGGETALAFASATDALAERLMRWHAAPPCG